MRSCWSRGCSLKLCGAPYGSSWEIGWPVCQHYIIKLEILEIFGWLQFTSICTYQKFWLETLEGMFYLNKIISLWGHKSQSSLGKVIPMKPAGKCSKTALHTSGTERGPYPSFVFWFGFVSFCCCYSCNFAFLEHLFFHLLPIAESNTSLRPTWMSL